MCSGNRPNQTVIDPRARCLIPWSVGELRFPNTRREIDDILRGMLAHTLQDIDQIRVDIDTMQLAGRDQALNNADLLGTQLGPAEQLVAPFIES